MRSDLKCKTVQIATSVGLLDAQELEQALDNLDVFEVAPLVVVRSLAAHYASSGREIFQPMADLVAGKEVSAEHLFDVALWAGSLNGLYVYRWLESLDGDLHE